MELIHYRHDDTIEQISEKTNKNLRQMSVQFDQKFGPLLSAVEALSSAVDSLKNSVDLLTDQVSDMQDQIDGIDTAPPVGSYMLSDDDPQDYYTGTTWSYLETIVTDNDTRLNLYKRYQ